LVLEKLRAISLIGGADVIGTGITAIFWFFLASQIPPDQFGEIFYFIGIASTVGAFVIVGSQNSITVFSSKNIKIESTLYFLSLLISVMGSFIIMLLFYRTDIVFLLFGYVLNILAIGEILGKKNFSLYSKHTILQKILTVGLGLCFFYLFGIDGILYALAISYVFFIFPIFKQFKNSKIDFSLLESRYKFIVNNYLIEIFNKLNSHLNKFLIVPLLGFGILGNFSLAQQAVSLGLIFTVIVFKYTVPHDSQGEENKKLKLLTFIIGVVISCTGYFLSPLIIPVFFPEYLEAVDAIKILSFSIIPITVTRIFTSKFLGQEKSKLLLLSKILSLGVFIISILTLGVSHGIVGISVGYLLSTLVEALLLLPYSQKVFSRD
jgi:O-antigen/teichoic acid export membrane protein